jgi:RimJ/RimL family protein N-acetyltransferase
MELVAIETPRSRMPRSPTTILRRLADVRLQHGTPGAAALVIDRLARRIARFEVLHLVWLDIDQLAGYVWIDPEFTFKFLAQEEVAGFARDPAVLHPQFIPRAALGRDLCFAAVQGDRLAAYTWFAPGGIEAGPCCFTDLSYPDDVAYAYASFTAPQFRGQRLHSQALWQALRALRASHGTRRAFATIDWTNWKSLRSFRRQGFQTVGRICTCGWGSRTVQTHPREAIRRGVRFGKDARPRARDFKQSQDMAAV